MNQADILEKVKAPIPGDSPVGEDPKYEAAYEGIREEVAKTSGIGHGACDWQKVFEDSLALISETAKEMNVMTYLSCGLAYTQGVPGLLTGLQAFGEFLDLYWENMFPSKKKVKIRARSLEWLQDRLHDLKDQDGLKTENREELNQAIEAVEAFKDKIYSVFEEPPVNFKTLKGYFEEQLHFLGPEPEPEPEPSPEAEQESNTDAKVETTTEAKPEPKPSTESKPAKKKSNVQFEAPQLAEDADVAEVMKALGQMADQLTKADPSIIGAYTIRRQSAWFTAKEPKNQGGETMIMPPSDDIQNSLKTMMGKAAWPNLLQRAEDLTTRFPLWLDIQFYAATACEMLGDSHAQILRTIQWETYLIDQRVPSLKSMKFNDGTPFATTQTKNWLEGLEGSLTGGGGSADPVEIFRNELMKIGVDRFAEALSQGQKAIDMSRSPREAFRLRTELAQFCYDANQSDWAFAFCQTLDSDAEEHRLERWDPQLCGKAYALMLKIAREQDVSNPEWNAIKLKAMRKLSQTQVGLVGELPAKNQD